MRYLCMHKASPADEAGLPPPPELIAGMGRLIEESAPAGIFLSGGGLRPSRERLRLRFDGGECRILHGPLRGEHELPAGVAILKVATKDEAIDWAKRFGAAVGADEIELGPLNEPWDLGLCPRPEGAPLQFMILDKATAATEAAERPSPERSKAFDALLAEMREQGVLTFCERLLPSTESVRVHYRGGRRTAVDGPFAESKELIGGFAMLRLDSREAALAWADRFAQVIAADLELDIRPVAEPSP